MRIFRCYFIIFFSLYVTADEQNDFKTDWSCENTTFECENIFLFGGMADNVEYRDASRSCWITILSVKVHIYPRRIMAHAQYVYSLFVFNHVLCHGLCFRTANMHFTSYE